MTHDSAPAMRPRLSFGRTFREAFSQVFGQFRGLAKLALLPMILSVGISAVIFAMTSVDPKIKGLFLYTTALHLLGFLPFTIFGVACCRQMLLGEKAGLIPRLLLGRRQRIWFTYSLLSIVILALPFTALFLPWILFSIFTNPMLALVQLMAVPVRVIMPWQLFTWAFKGDDLLFRLGFFPQSGRFGTFFPYAGEISFMVTSQYLWFWSGFLVLMLVLMRFSLVLPGLAVDDRKGETEDYRLGLSGAWRLARGNGLKLIAILFVLAGLAMVARSLFLFASPKVYHFLNNLTGLLPRYGDDYFTLAFFAPIHIGEFAIIYICIAVVCAALCSAYAQLRGWNALGAAPSETKNPGAHPA
ncbi:hypothetical protein [Denitrobaculum tricleocarpae]|uniref:Uncharacterized protein n=1 Tax=Denitrobaculum tricleocarpae TaxID=2591009 RepID=A0A545T5E8_9PROT|nr:hypothetical protein [Denitrobaculum tricleocarpae]TQV72456.1 hypothetical protein FKG95_25620 [Denitrobaculum tricleocarpae]